MASTTPKKQSAFRDEDEYDTLRSPLSTLPSPVKGKGLAALFPRDANRRHRAHSNPRKGFDLSDWQSDLADISRKTEQSPFVVPNNVFGPSTVPAPRSKLQFSLDFPPSPIPPRKARPMSHPHARSRVLGATNAANLSQSNPPSMRNKENKEFDAAAATLRRRQRALSCTSTDSQESDSIPVSSTPPRSVRPTAKSVFQVLSPLSNDDSADSSANDSLTSPSPIRHHTDFLSTRKVASMDNIFLASLANSKQSPFGKAGTIAAPGGGRVSVNPSAHPLRTPLHDASSIGRKRNANGAMIIGITGARGGSRLAANSPMLPHHPTSPFAMRDPGEDHEMDDEEGSVLSPTLSGDDRSSRRGSGAYDEDVAVIPPLTDASSYPSSLASSQRSSLNAPNLEQRFTNPLISALAASEGAKPRGFATPEAFKTIKPLQTAFMSTGLISKRNRPRESMVGAPPIFGMAELQYAPDYANSLGATEDSATSEAIYDMLAASTGSNSARFGHMPDTPVKKSAFSMSTGSMKSSNPNIKVSDAAPRRKSVPGIFAAAQTDPSDFLINSTAKNNPCLSPISSSCASPSSTSNVSPVSSGQSETMEQSPTAAARKQALRKNGFSSALGKIAKRGPPLFRRKSSAQLSITSDGSLSSRNNSLILDIDPHTPTRTIFGAKTLSLEAAQLVTSPLPSPVPPHTPCEQSFSFATKATLRPDLPLPSVSKQSKIPTSTVYHHPATKPRLSNPPVARPVIRQHHSGTTIPTVRNKQHSSPDRFDTEFNIVKPLGRGEFSDAYAVQEIATGAYWAIKKTKQPFAGPKDRLRQYEEVDILRFLSDDEDERSIHIVRFADVWEQGGHLFIQMELCGHGNVTFFFEEFGRIHEGLEETRLWKILAELIAGLHYMHSRNILHLDIKPANIFVTERGGLKIGDLGLATRWPRASAVDILQGAAVDSADENAIAQKRKSEPTSGYEEFEREGDREYIAPEILSGHYSKKADMFAVGLILIEALANICLPDNGEEWLKLRSDDLSDVRISPRLSAEIMRVIRGLMASNENERLGSDELIKHPIISQLVQLRSAGAKKEAELSNSFVPELAGSRMVAEHAFQGGNSNLETAQGAIYLEHEDFLPRVWARAYGNTSAMPANPLLLPVRIPSSQPAPSIFDISSTEEAMQLD